MILIPILIGLYFIGIVGYWKTLRLVLSQSEKLQQTAEELGLVFTWLLAIIALVWPFAMYFFIVKAALQ